MGFMPGLRTRRTFGGARILAYEVMFALAADDGLYLKANAASEASFRD